MAWTLLLSACLLCVFLCTHAQEHVVIPYYSSAKGGISVLVDNPQITRQGQSAVSLQMQFSLAGVRQPGNYITELIPRLYTATEYADFPAVRLLGRSAYYHEVRSPDAPEDAVMEMRDRDAYEPQAYAKQIPYQPWMSAAKLKFIVQTMDGCGGEKSHTEKDCRPSNLLPVSTMLERRQPQMPNATQAQQLQGRANISFRVNRSDIDPAYQNNTRELERIRHSIDSLQQNKNVVMKHVTLKGYASPEGPYLLNVQLASERVHNLKQYLIDNLGLDRDIISVDYEPEDWNGLRQAVECSQRPERDALLAIINGNMEPDAKLRTILVRYPRAYRYLQDSVFVNLRHTDYRIDYVKASWAGQQHSTDRMATGSVLAKTDTAYLLPEGSAPELTGCRLRRYKPLLAVKTNLLFDAAMAPNIELEVPLGRKGNWSRWSLMAEMWLPWWRLCENEDGFYNPYLRFDQRPTRKALEMMTGGLELRYWFWPRCNGTRPWLSGTFIGVYAAGGKYDLEWKSEGSQGEFVSAGISIGHSWAIARHWNLELSAAAGYVYTPYRYYQAEFDDTHLIYRYSNRKHLFLPTKAKISLVYILGKKGGAK